MYDVYDFSAKAIRTSSLRAKRNGVPDHIWAFGKICLQVSEKKPWHIRTSSRFLDENTHFRSNLCGVMRYIIFSLRQHGIKVGDSDFREFVTDVTKGIEFWGLDNTTIFQILSELHEANLLDVVATCDFLAKELDPKSMTQIYIQQAIKQMKQNESKMLFSLSPLFWTGDCWKAQIGITTQDRDKVLDYNRSESISGVQNHLWQNAEVVLIVNSHGFIMDTELRFEALREVMYNPRAPRWGDVFCESYLVADPVNTEEATK